MRQANLASHETPGPTRWKLRIRFERVCCSRNLDTPYSADMSLWSEANLSQYDRDVRFASKSRHSWECERRVRELLPISTVIGADRMTALPPKADILNPGHCPGLTHGFIEL
jgi:hypothetical protein